MSNTNETAGCIGFFIERIVIIVAVIAFFLGFSYGIEEEFEKTWHDIWHTTKVEKQLKKQKHEQIIANRTTSEDLQIRISVGLQYAFGAVFLPMYHFILWIVKGGWVLLAVLAGVWGCACFKTEFFDDPPEK